MELKKIETEALSGMTAEEFDQLIIMANDHPYEAVRSAIITGYKIGHRQGFMFGQMHEEE